jgi:Ca2+-transporting ATPase
MASETGSRMVETPSALPADEVLSELQVDPAQGLSRREVQKHRRRFGANRLRQARRRSPWRILADQFKSMVLVVLLVAAGLALAVGELPEGIALMAVVCLCRFGRFRFYSSTW